MAEWIVRPLILHMRINFSSMLFLLIALIFATESSVAQTPSDSDLLRSRALFEEGNQFLNKGAPQEAVGKYSEAIALTPSEPLPYINRGVAFVFLSKFAEALQDADKALSIMETGLHSVQNKAIAYEVKGMVYQGQGNNQLAIENFTKSIEFAPTSARTFSNRGNSYRFLKKYPEAMKDFDTAIELDATLPHAFVNRGAVHAILKNLAAALQDLNEAVRLNDSSEMAHYNRAAILVALTKYDDALNDYNKAIELKPRAEFYNARGKLYFQVGKYDLTVQDNTQALALDPKNAYALGDRAVAYSKLKKNSEAIADIRKALALKGESSLMRYSLAYFLYTGGQYAAAADEATRIIVAAPDWQLPYRLRANCFIKLGNQVKAKADRATASKLSPGNKPKEGDAVISFDLVNLEDVSQ